MPNVTQALCLDIRHRLNDLVSDLGNGSFRDKLQRADLEGWERDKYMEYWKFANNGMNNDIGNQKGRCNEILDDLKWTHKF